jgi:tRNA-uridine 2-sulfurtransferase
LVTGTRAVDMNRKAISLLSGGLDSTLATRLVLDQGIAVVALHFTSLFCTCSKGGRGCGIQAVRTAAEMGVPVMVRNKGMEYLEIVKAPKHGYGRGLNPCIDCRIFILREARKVMDEVGASFVVTGEVLGQRPMSQHRDALKRIEKESGLEDRIVRPLSARHFDPTLPEQEGIIDRDKLLGVSRRSRKTQYSLVGVFNLKEFSCPGGGCLLTDAPFAAKLRDIFSHGDFTIEDVALLKVGRHFRLSADTKLIIGRNEEENEHLSSMWSTPHVLLAPQGFKGPLGILSGLCSHENIAVSANIMAHYGKNVRWPVTIESNNGSVRLHKAEKISRDWDAIKL